MNSNAKDFSIQLDLGGDVGVSRAGFYGWIKIKEMRMKISNNLNVEIEYYFDNLCILLLILIVAGWNFVYTIIDALLHASFHNQVFFSINNL